MIFLKDNLSCNTTCIQLVPSVLVLTIMEWYRLVANMYIVTCSWSFFKLSVTLHVYFTATESTTSLICTYPTKLRFGRIKTSLKLPSTIYITQEEYKTSVYVISTGDVKQLYSVYSFQNICRLIMKLYNWNEEKPVWSQCSNQNIVLISYDIGLCQ